MILSGINNYCATSAMKNQLDESTDICNDDDGVTIDDVSKMVSLGNAEVLEVKYQNGKVTKLKIKSNNYEFELQSDGNFKVNGEWIEPVDPTDSIGGSHPYIIFDQKFYHIPENVIDDIFGEN